MSAWLFPQIMTGISNEVCFTSISSSVNLRSTLSQSQKYHKIHSKLQHFVLGMPEIRDKYVTLEMVLKYWENNDTFSIVPTEDGTTSTKVNVDKKLDMVATDTLCHCQSYQGCWS